MTVKYELGHEKLSWWEKKCGATKCWSLVVQLSCSCRFSLISHQLHLKSLYFSAPRCEGWLRLFFIRRSKLKNSCKNWLSPSQNWSVARNNQSFLANWTDSALSSHYSLWLLDILPDHLYLGSTAPFSRPPPTSFLLSLRLTMPAVSLPAAVQNTIPEGVLSQCGCSLTLTHTLPQWRDEMVRVPRDLDSTLYHYHVVDSFGSFVFDWLCILSVTFQFLFNRGLFLWIAGLKLKNSLTKWKSPQLRIPETNHSFSENWQDSCLSSEYLITLFPVLSAHRFISVFLYPFCPKHNSIRRSLFVRVLSHSDTHHLNRHMVGCGCHERNDQSRSS